MSREQCRYVTSWKCMVHTYIHTYIQRMQRRDRGLVVIHTKKTNSTAVGFPGSDVMIKPVWTRQFFLSLSLSLSFPNPSHLLSIPPSSHLNIIADGALMCGYPDKPLASLFDLPQLEMTLANKQPVCWVETWFNWKKAKQKNNPVNTSLDHATSHFSSNNHKAW